MSAQGVFSTVGDTISTPGDTISTPGNIISTPGNIMSTVRGYHDYTGGCSIHRGFHTIPLFFQ